MNRHSFRNIIKQGFSDVFYIWMKELREVIKDEGVFIFFILVPIAYPLLYTYIYTNEVIREVPVAVVDYNRSSQSRQFLRSVDGTADVSIKTYSSDIEEAKKAMKEGEVYGIIYIPESFSSDIAKGKQTRVSLYCDLSGMLYYKAILTATTNVSLEMNKKIKISRLGNTTNRQDEISAMPIEYEDISLFNPQNGFASFLLPAVLILIIQQTLLLGIGLAAGTARERSSFMDLVPTSRHYNGTIRIVLGKSLLYLMVYLIMSVYVLILVPRLFSLNQIANFDTVVAFIFPYLLACIFFSMACSVMIHQRESCMVIYIFTSVPLLFISGISWPGAAIPEFWRIISYLFPSTFGINGFVHINNMGATINDISFEYHALWLQTGIYFIITCIVYRYQIMRTRNHVIGQYREKKAKLRLK